MLLEGPQGICSQVLLPQAQGLGSCWDGGEASVEMSEDEDAQAAQQNSSPRCELGWPWSRGWWGQGQNVAPSAIGVAG